MLTAQSTSYLRSLLATSQRDTVAASGRSLARYLRHLDAIDCRPAGPGYESLRSTLELVSEYLGEPATGPDEPATTTPGTRAAARDADHDYGDWHRLARSAWFNWGETDTSWQAAAAPPRLWCASRLLASSAPGESIKVAEVGAGVGRLAYDIGADRPAARVWVGDAALESLIVAAVLTGGSDLELPRRTSFEKSPHGIAWFRCGPARAGRTRPQAAMSFQVGSKPPDVDNDYLVAVNAVSLFADPLATVRELARHVRIGGFIIMADLFCWRVETPAPRRVLGIAALAEALHDAGHHIVDTLCGIPYLEDWGFERTYQWVSHGIVGQRER